MVARLGRIPVAPPGEYWSSERIFFCAVSRLSIESRLPALTPTKRRGRPMREMSTAVPRRLRDEADLVAAALEKARDEDRPERRVVDVRVAGDDEDVELVPAAGVHLLAVGGEKEPRLRPAGALRRSLGSKLDERHEGRKCCPK